MTITESKICECCKKVNAKVHDYRSLPEKLVGTEYDKNIVKHPRFKYREFVTCLICWKLDDSKFWSKVKRGNI